MTTTATTKNYNKKKNIYKVVVKPDLKSYKNTTINLSQKTK